MENVIFCAVYYCCISLQQPWLNNYRDIELAIEKPCHETNSPKSDFVLDNQTHSRMIISSVETLS